MTLIVRIDKNQVSSEIFDQELRIDLSLIGKPFGFDMTSFEAKPIGCNLDDTFWDLTLPELTYPNALDVKITMLTETELFSFKEEAR